MRLERLGTIQNLSLHQTADSVEFPNTSIERTLIEHLSQKSHLLFYPPGSTHQLFRKKSSQIRKCLHNVTTFSCVIQPHYLSLHVAFCSIESAKKRSFGLPSKPRSSAVSAENSESAKKRSFGLPFLPRHSSASAENSVLRSGDNMPFTQLKPILSPRGQEDSGLADHHQKSPSFNHTRPYLTILREEDPPKDDGDCDDK